MYKIKELFYILKSDEDGKQFFYDKDLNKDYQFDYEHWSGKGEHDCRWFCCYLFTKDEIELMKKKIGDGNYLELDDINDEYPIGMYVIFTMKYEAWIKDIQHYNWIIGRIWDDKYGIEDASKISFDWANESDEFEDYMQKKCDGSYFDGNLVRRALEKSRIYPDFIKAYLDIYSKDYELQWWRIRNKRKKKGTKFYDSDYSDDFEYYSRYEKYNGYNGYDDDTIDDAFDGFPEATWNVD